jgi:hypothetical protein
MMSYRYHHDVRTTLTLDPDVASRLKVASQRSGRSFKKVVNDALRRGLAHADEMTQAAPFAVKTHDFGGTRPGVNLDKIGTLLAHLEGPEYK